MTPKHLKYATAVLALMALSPLSVQAQDTDTTEVIVTATKRATRLQSVPISVTALSGEALADRQLKDGIGIARQTPNLVAESVMGAAMPRFRLRGIGTNDFVQTATAAVAIYSDEVNLSAGSIQSQPLYDLERVEVLRGPQGSLWGKNTTAGAIHYVTVQPSAVTQGQARISYGSDNTQEIEAGFGGPLSDRLSGRIAGVYKHRDGQFHNGYTGRRDGAYDIWDVRGQLLWQLNDDASLRFRLYGGTSEQEQPLQHIGLLAGGTDFDGYRERDGDENLSNNAPSSTRAERFGGDATLKIDFSGFSLTDILSYQDSSSLIHSDDDANPISTYHERYGGESRTVTNELRLASHEGGRFGWIAGVYYLHDKTNSFGQLALYSPVNFGVDGAAYDFDVTTRNLAAFASVNFQVTERLKFTLGARQTHEKKSVSGRAWDYETNPANVFDASRPINLYIDTANGVYEDGFGAQIAPVPTSRSWNRATWDVTADYKLSDEALVFARIARGFRSGNYNTYIASPGDLSVYDPETLTSYEIGAKTGWFDRRLILNATVFHYDFEDMQVTVLQNVGTKTQNAAAAESDGFEIELSARPVPELGLSLGYGYQKSEYTNFSDASVPAPINQGNPLDLTGQSLERAPKQTFNASATWDIRFATGTLTLNTDWRYTSRYRFHVWSDATHNTVAAFLDTPELRQLVRDSFSQDAYWLGDARVSWRFDSNGLELAAWVRNLTDEVYRTNTFGMFFNRSITTYPGERRTAGVSLNYRF